MTRPNEQTGGLTTWLDRFFCLSCGSNDRQRLGDDGLECERCGSILPIENGTVSATPRYPDSPSDEVALKQRTGESFAFEWQRFGSFRKEWAKNFIDYMQPHGAEFFDGLRLLDAGSGSGRHSAQAAKFGASVVAVDIGSSIEIARANTPNSVLTIRADLESIPLKPDSFDMVMSIGVLHHLPDPARALNALVPLTRRGGIVRIYLYWKPERAWHRAILRGVSAARRITTRIPHRFLLALCYPLAVALMLLFVLPFRLLRRFTATRGLAMGLPLKIYADYPFGVLVNDQFDRLSAPIENRYTSDEVRQMMRDAGLSDVKVYANAGWVSEGIRS